MYDTARAMRFDYPQWIASNSEFIMAKEQLTSVAALDTKVRSLGQKQLNSGDCEAVSDLFRAADSQLIPYESGNVADAEPDDFLYCRMFLDAVNDAFVKPYVDAKRYIYIPFDPGESADMQAATEELLEWAAIWHSYSRKKYGGRRNYEVIVWSSREKRLENIPPLSRIYIYGHTSPGSDTLSPCPGAPANLRVSFQKLTSQMLESGLSKEFWGRIKVWACSSAATSRTGRPDAAITPGDFFSFSTGRTVVYAFADKFAEAMRGVGYENCQYFGYLLDLAAPKAFELLGGRFANAMELDIKDDHSLLAALQAVQDRLYSDSQFRAKFTAKFEKVADIASLSEEERGILANRVIRLNLFKKPSSVRKEF